ncbi:zf-HC2 domain-containing protein [Pseudoramibacter faecis]|uniref:zf-HC2 domain-containing protein n=1 Tax=Pseudoramibacter faecis TaxID=3108534 RepID=UPI002E78CEFE|nr:zf-HC2 domain-containing protein [Pseudoramibacter sp. HA2172]
MNERQDQSADTCAVVRDLLPLYVDGVCSEASAALVEAHLADCPACSRLATDLKKEEIEAAVGAEKRGVLTRHRQAQQRTAWRAGAIIADLLMIPVIIAGVVALAGGAEAGVPMVLAAAMALVASLTVVPMMARRNRLAKAIVAATMAIVLTEVLVIAFFDGGSIIDVVTGTIFGISLVFFPFVVRGAALPPVLAHQKALIVVAWDTLWLYLTILAVTLVSGDTAGCREGALAATLFVVPVWLVLFAAKLPRAGRLTKAGLITWILSLWLALLGDLGRLLFEGRRGFFLTRVDFGRWAQNQAFNANLALLVLMIGLAVGGILLAAGRRRDRCRAHERTVD